VARYRAPQGGAVWHLFNRISVRNKFIAGFAMAFVWTLGLGGFAVERLDAVERAAADLRDNALQATVALARIGQAAERLRSTQQLLVTAVAEERRNTLLAEQEAQAQHVQDAIALYQPTIKGEQEQHLADAFMAAWANYMKLTGQLVSMIGQVQPDIPVAFLNGRLLQAMSQFRAALGADLDLKMQEGHQAADAGQAMGDAARRLILGALAVSLVMCVLGGWVMIAAVAQPITAMNGMMRRLSQHDLTVAISFLDRRDEIGAMAASVEQFKRGIVDAEAAQAEHVAEQGAKDRRAAELEVLVGGFEEEVGQLVDHLSGAAATLETTARSMSQTAGETNRQTSAVAASAEQARANVQAVADATESLASAIAVIGRQGAESAAIAERAVADARQADAIAQALSLGTQKIDDVLQLIGAIAGKTNLLALNATIEAARAGEAGKGFAVVASEVKALAGQTAKATGEIAQQVQQIQTATKETVEAVHMIGLVVERVGSIAASIAAAVEEQHAATAAIAQNVQQAAGGTRAVSVSIEQVDRAVTATGASADEVLASASDLTKRAEFLSRQMSGFAARFRTG
jgi:methyl-accepting chemotaxis protein